MKRTLSTLLVLLLAFSVFANGGSETNKKTTVTIWYDGTEQAKFERLEPEFEALHPEIDLVLEIIPYADLSTREMVACQASSGPDLMWQSYAWTNSFAKMGLLESFTPYLEKSNKIKLSDFDQTSLELGTVEGQTYGLPWSTEAMCLVYNKEMFREAGLDPEKPPRTWDEVIEYAKVLTKDVDSNGSIDQYGYGLVGNLTGNTWFRFIPEIWSAGGEICDDNLDNALLNSSEVIEAAKYYSGLLTEYHVAPEGSVNNGAAEVRTLFSNGRIGMYVDGQSAVMNIQKDAPNLDVGVALWPGKNGPLKAGLGGYYVAMPKNAKNKDAAWTFLEYFLSEEVQEWFPNAFPANVEARKAARFSEGVNIIFAEQVANTKNFPPLANTPAAQQAILDAVQSMLAGIKTPEQAMADANAAIQLLLK